MLQVDDLGVALQTDSGWAHALNQLQLCLTRGKTFALVGESGCGKSLTALALMRLLPQAARITQGRVTIERTNLLALPEREMRGVRGGRIGMIFQEPGTSLNPVMPIGAQILETIHAHTALRGAQARASALHWLTQVGLPEPEQRFGDYPFRLSGGQKQRVMIAMALAAQPDYLIADEPTTALDVIIQAQILELLKNLQRSTQLGILLITHDLGVVRHMADHVALMYVGQMVEVATCEAFFKSPQHPYAHALLASLPSRSQRGQTLSAIEGSVPSMTQTFPGCRFANRCHHVAGPCEAAPIDLQGPLDHRVRCWRTPIIASRAAHPTTCAHAPTAAPVLLQVQHLSVQFPKRTAWGCTAYTQVVDDVSFSVHQGQTLALVGESGCGKSTTGKAIVQLLRKQARMVGQVRFDGQDLMTLPERALKAMRQKIQIIFQDPFASLNPRLRVDEILLEGLHALRPDLDAAAKQKKLHALLDQVGLNRAALQRWPHEFSGGQRQRIAIARALAVEPTLIVCDEPTSALDVCVQAQILNLLRSLQQSLQISYIFITHNIAVVEYLSDHLVVMQHGKIQEAGMSSTVLSHPQSPYTQQLLSSAAQAG